MLFFFLWSWSISVASSVVARFLDFWLSEIQFCLLRFIILALFSLVLVLHVPFSAMFCSDWRRGQEGCCTYYSCCVHAGCSSCRACPSISRFIHHTTGYLPPISSQLSLLVPHNFFLSTYCLQIFSVSSCRNLLEQSNNLVENRLNWTLNFHKTVGLLTQYWEGFLSGSNVIMSQLWRCLLVEAYDSPTHSLWYWTWYERQLETDVAFWFKSLVREDWMNTTSTSALKIFCPHILTQCWYHCQISGVVSFTSSFLIHWCGLIIRWILVLYALCAFPGDSGVSMLMKPISCGLKKFQVAQCLVVDIHCFWFQNRRYYSGGNQLTNTVMSSRREINLAQFSLNWHGLF